MLHEQFASWLERHGGADDLVGYHVEQAYLYRVELGPLDGESRALARRAAQLLAAAGRQAFRRGDMPGASGLLQRAVALPSGNSSFVADILPDLGYALVEVGETDRADEVLAAACLRAAETGDLEAEWRAAVKRAHLRMFTTPDVIDLDELRRTGEEAVRVLTALEDDLGLVRAWTFISDVDWMHGRGRETHEALEHAAAHARKARSQRDEAWAWGALGTVAIEGPLPVDEGLTLLGQLLDTADGPVLEANLLAFVAVLEAMTGQTMRAREHMTRGVAVTTELGLSWQRGIHRMLSADLDLLTGDLEAAESALRESIAFFQSIGDRWYWSTVAVRLPTVLYAQGRYADAWRAVEALAEAPASPDMEWQVKRRGTHARLLARDGKHGEAEELASEGVALAEDTDMLVWQGDAWTALADVLALTGRPQRAVTPLHEALDRFTRKGYAVAAARVREQLGSAVPAHD